MDNNKILEQMKEDLIYSSNSLQHVNVNDTMTLGSDASILVNRNYLTYVPYETEEREPIHGNTRNSIAKQFIEKYNLNELIKEYQEHINKMILEEQEHVKSYEAMEVLANELEPLFCGYGTLEARHNYGIRIAELEYNCKIKTADQWNKYSERIKIVLKDNIYNIERVVFNRCQSGDKETYQFTLEELKSFIPELLKQYKRIEAEEEPKIKAIEEERQRQSKIDDIACKICTDKEHTYILKNKRSFVGIRNNYKWAAGIGKEGKYIRTDYFKIAKLIKEKGITEVIVLDDDANTNRIDWNKEQFTNLLDIV